MNKLIEVQLALKKSKTLQDYEVTNVAYDIIEVSHKHLNLMSFEQMQEWILLIIRLESIRQETYFSGTSIILKFNFPVIEIVEVKLSNELFFADGYKIVELPSVIKEMLRQKGNGSTVKVNKNLLT